MDAKPSAGSASPRRARTRPPPAAGPAPAPPPTSGARRLEQLRKAEQSKAGDDKDELQQEFKRLAAIDPGASVASAASATKLGELFQYTVGSVTLPRQKSAMIPIV